MKPRVVIQSTYSLLKDTRFRQSAVLLGAMILAMGLNFIASIITARNLGPENYGDIKFIQIIWSLLTLLFSFGYFHSGSRILVIEKEAVNIREITGTILTISFLIGISLSFLTAIISRPIDVFFHIHISDNMMRLAPLVFVLSVQAALILILQGVNRIYLLSILNVLPVLFYLLAIITLSYLKSISTMAVLISNQISSLLVILLIVPWLRPSFTSIKHWWDVIQEHNKTYGGPVYLGSLANVATSYINSLAISYWVDNTSIGFYSLAVSLTEPLKLIPNAVATSSFRSFADQRRISKKIILTTVGVSIIALAITLWFFGQPLSWVYTKNFAPVGAMARVLSMAAIMVGFGDFFNRFLGAHGKGKALRNVAYLVGGVNVAGFFLLVPRWGAAGVVSTSVLAGFTYFLFMYAYYVKNISTAAPNLKPNTQENGINETEVNGSGVLKNSTDILEGDGGKPICGSKVVILLDSFGFPNGMASTRRVQLIARTLVQNGFQVKILCVRALEKPPLIINEKAYGDYEGIPFEYTPGTTVRSNKFLVRRYIDIKGMIVVLTRLVTHRINHQIDCIYYYGNIMENTPNRWIFYLAAKILGIPIVTDISEPPWSLNQQASWFDRLLSPLTGVNGVILISKFLKDWVIDTSSKDRKAVSILQLPILVDSNEHEFANSRKRQSDDKAVLFAGSDINTIKFIIEAMENVWREYPDCRLIITGFEPGNDRHLWLNNLIEHGPAKGKVSVTGYLPRTELHHLYQNVSALLIPLFNDIRSQARFPTKIAEYLCSGTPIVTCRAGEVEQYLKNGVSAFVCDPDNPDQYAEKIIEAINPQNRERASQIGQNGKDTVSMHFDVYKYEKPITTFFSSICSQGNSTR